MRSYFLLFSFPSCGEEGRGGGGFVLLDGAVEVDKSRFYETMNFSI